MASRRVGGTEGYAEAASALVRQYESISFGDVHRSVSYLFPATPGVILDIGAGTGRDAAGFAAIGHRVVAVEPTAALRTHAIALHQSPAIEWVDDSLPALRKLTARGELFDLVMLTAVWMHLDRRQRRRAMPNVPGLLRAEGVMIMSLRFGPVPAGRRMFVVSPEETAELADAEGLSLVFREDAQGSVLQSPGVSWTRLAFKKEAGVGA
jgi:SAM-dependent methyltransferase